MRRAWLYIRCMQEGVLRQASGTFLRMLVCAGGQWSGQEVGVCACQTRKRGCRAAAGASAAFWSPHTGQRWPCSRPPDSGAGPAPASSQTSVRACALSVLSEQMVGLRLFVLRRKEEPPEECVAVALVSPLRVSGEVGSAVCQQEAPRSTLSLTGSVCLGLRGKKTRKHKTHQIAQLLLFSMFSIRAK